MPKFSCLVGATIQGWMSQKPSSFNSMKRMCLTFNLKDKIKYRRKSWPLVTGGGGVAAGRPSSIFPGVCKSSAFWTASLVWLTKVYTQYSRVKLISEWLRQCLPESSWQKEGRNAFLLTTRITFDGSQTNSQNQLHDSKIRCRQVRRPTPGGLWYTEDRDDRFLSKMSRRTGSICEDESSITGFSAKTTSFAASGSVLRSLQYTYALSLRSGLSVSYRRWSTSFLMHVMNSAGWTIAVMLIDLVKYTRLWRPPFALNLRIQAETCCEIYCVERHVSRIDRSRPMCSYEPYEDSVKPILRLLTGAALCLFIEVTSPVSWN